MVKTKDLRGQFRDLDKKDVHKLLILQARFQLLIRIYELYQKESDKCFSGGYRRDSTCRGRHLAALYVRNFQGCKGHL